MSSLLVVVLAQQAGAAAPDCPPLCAYDSKSRNGGCGVVTTLLNGTQGYVCPQALVFSAGFDSDMVLQRAPAKAAVYGVIFGVSSHEQCMGRSGLLAGLGIF